MFQNFHIDNLYQIKLKTYTQKHPYNMYMHTTKDSNYQRIVLYILLYTSTYRMNIYGICFKFYFVLENFPKALDMLLNTQRKVINTITKSDETSYTKVLKPLQDLDEEFGLFFTPLSYLNSVMNSEET